MVARHAQCLQGNLLVLGLKDSYLEMLSLAAMVTGFRVSASAAASASLFVYTHFEMHISGLLHFCNCKVRRGCVSGAASAKPNELGTEMVSISEYPMEAPRAPEMTTHKD